MTDIRRNPRDASQQLCRFHFAPGAKATVSDVGGRWSAIVTCDANGDAEVHVPMNVREVTLRLHDRRGKA